MKKLITSAFAFCLMASMAFAQTGERLPAFREMYKTGTAPSAGITCVQTGTLGATITGGTFNLNYAGMVTAPITWVGTNATLVTNIQNALNALPTIGTGQSTVAAGTMVNGAGGTFTVTFGGNLSKQVLPVMSVQANNMTGAAHTLTFAITTAGVEADGRILPKGALIMAADTGKWYTNSGTPPNPVWSIITSTP